MYCGQRPKVKVAGTAASFEKRPRRRSTEAADSALAMAAATASVPATSMASGMSSPKSFRHPV